MKTLKVATYLTYNGLKNGNKGVSLLTIFMLVLVFINLLAVPGLMDGVVRSFNKAFIDGEVSHITINPAQGNQFIENYSEFKEQIESLTGVKAVTSKRYVNAEFVFNGIIIEAPVTIIDVDSHKDVFVLDDSLIEGEFLQSSDKDNVVVGVQIAGVDDTELELYYKSFKSMHAGDMVEMNIQGITKDYVVKGVYKSNFMLPDSSILISELEGETYAPSLKNMARSVHIRVNDESRIDSIVDILKIMRPELSVVDWEDQAGLLKSMQTSFAMISGLLSGIALVVAAITVFIITYVDLVSKKRHIGIQRAIGINPSVIVLSYVFRAIIYTVLGTFFGLISYQYILLPLEHMYPLLLPFGAVLLEIDPVYTFWIFEVLMVVSLISALVPTIKTLKVSILDAIWG